MLLSWQWPAGEKGEREYEAWYKDPTAYHTEEQAANGQKSFVNCYDQHLVAAEARLELLRPYLRGSDPICGPLMLDVGCGTGALVNVATAERIAAFGLEPCAGITQPPAAYFTDIGTWEDMRGSYDLIHSSDLFEHLTRPREFLDRTKQHLNEHGLIVIETPEWNGPDQLRAGWDWKHIRPRQHVCLYSREAAEQVYCEAGLEVVAFWRPLRGSIGKMTHVLQVAR